MTLTPPGIRTWVGVLLLAACLGTTTTAWPQDDEAVDLDALRVEMVQGSLDVRLRGLAQASTVLSEDATQVLVAALSDPAPEVRRLALRYLGGRGGVPTERFEPALSDEEPSVRAAVLHALARQPDDARLELVLRALNEDADDTVRAAAAEALRAFKDTNNPRCDVMLEQWEQRVAAGDTDNAVAEALAATLAADGGIEACQVFGEARSTIEVMAQRYHRAQNAPEVSLLGRSILDRLEGLRERIRKMDAIVTPDDKEYCVWPILNGPFESFEPMVEPIAVYGRTLMAGDVPPDAQNRQSPDEILRQLTETERLVQALEECVAQEHGGLDWKEPDFFVEPLVRRSWWMQLGIETQYDDHFLAVRHDVDTLRVTDQLSQRLLSQFQWTSSPMLMGQGPSVDSGRGFMRIRAEFGSDLFYGENELSGLQAWGDIYGHYKLGSSYLFGRFNSELDRGFYEVHYPEHLVAPRVVNRLLAGWRTNAPFDLPRVALGLFADTVHHLDGDLLAGASDRRSILVPEDLTQSDRVGFGALARWTIYDDYDFSFLLDGFVRSVFYPNGTPGIDSDAQPLTKGDWAVHGSIQPGVVVQIERLFRVWGWIGVDLFHIPDPFSHPIVNVSAEAWLALWEGDRSDEGGRMLLGGYRRIHDGPGREDLVIENGGEIRVQWWARESDFYVELDFDVYGHYLEFLVQDRDRDAIQVGLALRTAFSFGPASPVFYVDFSTQAERAEDRHQIFVDNLNRSRVGDEDDAFWRNIIMLGIYIPFGGTNMDFHEARRGRVGYHAPQQPVIPARWWRE